MSESADSAHRDSGDVAVLIGNGDWDSLDEPEQICEVAVQAALAQAERSDGPSVNVLLSDDEHLGKLNKRFRGMHGPTNVLAFPSGDAPPIASPPKRSHPVGDIAIAFQTMTTEAVAAGKPIAHHLSHLIVHGTLLLLGYDHRTNTQATAMEEMERRALRRLDIGDPYGAAAEANAAETNDE